MLLRGLCVLALGVIVLGCGSTRYEVLEAPAPLAGRRLEVRVVELDAALRAWADANEETSSEVMADLSEDLVDALVDDEATGPPLEVRARLVTYDVEYAPTRLMGGGGRRSATVVLDVRLLDAGRPAGRVQATGVSRSGGWYVASLGAATGRAIDAVVAFVEDHAR